MSFQSSAACRLRVLVLALTAAWALPGAAQEQAQPQAQAAPSAAEPDPHQLQAVVEAMQADLAATRKKLAAREAAYAERLAQSRQRLADAQALLARREAEGRALERRFDSNRDELDDKAELLKNKIGALKELFGVFQQNASDLIGAFVGSPTSLQYPDRDWWLEGFANRMKHASEVSSADDIRTLWLEVMREIQARGQIVRLRAPVYSEDPALSGERELVRVGGFNLISSEPAPEYLQWSTARQRVEAMPRQPEGPYSAQIERYLESDEGLHELSLDPSGGVLLSLLAEKPTAPERVDQGGLVGYMILGLGAVALVLALIKLLDISLIALRVHWQQRRLDQPAPGNPLGRLLQVYQDNRMVDSETLEMRLHDQVAREDGRINRLTIFLAIIAAVAPLMGLLGTVVGMINTFQAITLYGTGDPQTMAGGISQALITTVLGLIVAVPAVLLHAVVSARGKAVCTVLKQHSALLLGDRLAAESRRAA